MLASAVEEEPRTQTGRLACALLLRHIFSGKPAHQRDANALLDRRLRWRGSVGPPRHWLDRWTSIFLPSVRVPWGSSASSRWLSDTTAPPGPFAAQERVLPTASQAESKPTPHGMARRPGRPLTLAHKSDRRR